LIDGYEEAARDVPFYQLILNQKEHLDDMTKYEILSLITGYAYGQIECEKLIEEGPELSEFNH